MTSPHSRRPLATPLAIALAAALTAAYLVVGGQSSGSDPGASSTGQPSASASAGAAPATSEPGAGASEDPAAPQVARRTADDPLARGEVDAPVVLVNYSDFQCPFCGKWARDTAPKLEKYVQDGTLRIEWRDFPYLGEESQTTALATRAAARQDGFWKMHDALYADQPTPQSGTLTKDHLVELADSIGLDGAQLRADMDDPKTASAVRADFAEGQSLGVTGTPAFLVNGRPIMGAQPAKVFIQAVEQAAAEAR